MSKFSAKASENVAVDEARGKADLATFRGGGADPGGSVLGPVKERSACEIDVKAMTIRGTLFTKIGSEVLEVLPHGRLSRDTRRRRPSHSVCGTAAAPDINGFAS